jgi:hypothetical protein
VSWKAHEYGGEALREMRSGGKREAAHVGKVTSDTPLKLLVVAINVKTKPQFELVK